MKYLLLPLLFLDCLANLVIGSHSFNETLSAAAARVRASKQPYWGWTAHFIDALALALLGQEDHCKKQLDAETEKGGAWGVWKSL